MKKASFVLALLLTLSGAARALAPVSIETAWNQKTFSISTTGVTSVSIDVAGFGAAGYNLLGTTRTLNGVDGTTYGSTATTTSSDVNIVGFSWSAMSSGAAGSLQIAQTIKTPPPHGRTSSASFNNSYPASNNFSVPLISTSSTITLPNSITVSDEFKAQVTNPVFHFTGLTASATLYFSLSYGIPRVQ